MRRAPGPFRVYVGLVSTGYLVPEAIDQTIKAGLAYCGAASALGRMGAGGRVLVIPDVAMADPRVARHAYTNPEVLRGVLAGVLAQSASSSIKILGRSMQGFPDARVMRRANGGIERFKARGYFALEGMFPGYAEVAAGDKTPCFRYQLSKGGVLGSRERRELVEGGILSADPRLLQQRLDNEVTWARDFYDSTYVVYVPKIKSCAQSQGFSGAVRLGDAGDTGALADVHVCDMLEVCSPQLTVSDGLIAAVGGGQLTQRGHELGVIIAADNALAHDLVAARILNLDPMQINHLRIAIERGWGPASFNQIELGGDGIEAVRQLEQKTKFWDLGVLDVEQFGPKFERDNSGLSFPLEIVSGLPRESFGAHGVLLEWLYLSYDNPELRPAMARWPRVSVCVGRVTKYPTNKLVFAVGDAACEALRGMTSSTRQLLRLGRHVRLARSQLKNGARHFVVTVPGEPPPLRRLILAFALASFGNMLPRVFTRSLAFDRMTDLAKYLLSGFRGASARGGADNPARSSERLVIASHMRQNRWWALERERPDLAHAHDRGHDHGAVR